MTTSDLKDLISRLADGINDIGVKVGTGIDRIDRKLTGNTSEADALLRVIARHLFDLRSHNPKLADPLATSLSAVGFDETRPRRSEPFNPAVHSEVERVPTPKESLHGLVQSCKRSGLSRNGVAVKDYRAHVAVYRYQPQLSVEERSALSTAA